MEIKTTILSVCQNVAKEQQKPLSALDDNIPLLETGLDSLCMAVIVARLEDQLGFDPFSSGDEFEFPVTVGDFVKLYEQSAPANR